MNRNFTGNKKACLQTSCNILNTRKNIDSIEKINISKNVLCFGYYLAFLVKAAFLWEGARVVTPLRSPPIIQIILTFTPLEVVL